MSNKKKKNGKISSEYCLKSVFTYLEYDYILSLIKYNKTLQNKSEINYNNNLDYKCIKRNNMNRSYRSCLVRSNDDDLFRLRLSLIFL